MNSLNCLPPSLQNYLYLDLPSTCFLHPQRSLPVSVLPVSSSTKTFLHWATLVYFLDDFSTGFPSAAHEICHVSSIFKKKNKHSAPAPL